MRWQDLVFTAGSLLMTVSIVPMLTHEHKPPLKASVPVFVVLYIFAFTYTTLNFVLAPIIEFVQASLWFILAVQEWRRRAAAVH